MTSRTITIGELAVKVRSADLASQELDTAIASDFDVEVEFDYKQASIEDDQLAELKITAIKASSNIRFDGEVSEAVVRRGVDMKSLFSHSQITAIEDGLLDQVRISQDN